MKKLAFAALLMVALPVSASANDAVVPALPVETMAVLPGVAQEPPAIPGQKFEWGQPAPTLADASGYTYKYYPDGATTGVTFTGVTCAGSAAPFTCEVLIPAFTPGNHSITITASNVAGESPKSAPFAFTFVVTPAAPVSIRIK